MNLIASLLSPDNIAAGQTFSSKENLFEHAAALFETLQGLKQQEVYNSLIERERMGSTALGCGVAIPHGRIKSLKAATGAFYRLDAPLEFGAPDGLPVNLCFILLVPQDANELHLQILGELAQMLGDTDMRDRLLAAAPAELHKLLTTWTP